MPPHDIVVQPLTPEAVGGHRARELAQMVAGETGHGGQRRTLAVARYSIVTRVGLRSRPEHVTCDARRSKLQA